MRGVNQRVAARASGTALGFALSAHPTPRLLPAGFTRTVVGREEIARLRSDDRFPNALGETGEADRIEWTNSAIVIRDADYEPAAVCAWWDAGHGYSEVGVDVRDDSQGLGLGTMVVGEAVHRLLGAGQVPFYSCRADNIRSQRTALACGFLPVFLIA